MQLLGDAQWSLSFVRLEGRKDAAFLPRRPRGASRVCDRYSVIRASVWSQNWVTSQNSTTTTCPVCWDQVSSFLVKPSGAPRLLAAPRRSFVLELQEAKEQSDTKGWVPKLPTLSLLSCAGSARVLDPGGFQGSKGEICTATAGPCQELGIGGCLPFHHPGSFQLVFLLTLEPWCFAFRDTL